MAFFSERIRHRNFETLQDGFKALDTVFDPQNYGIVMPAGSDYRKAIDAAIL